MRTTADELEQTSYPSAGESSEPNLTEEEQRGLLAPINLSDGHPRQSLTASQEAIVARLPEIFRFSEHDRFDTIERRAQRVFLDSLGQSSAPVEDGRVFSVYSSSVATMAVRDYLKQQGHRVALIHPTFDNIPDLLRRGVELMPLPEELIESGHYDDLYQAGASSVFLTTPNNPTGWVIDEDSLRRLAAWAGERELLLCFDTSFRGFDRRAQYDMYRVLEQSNVDYIVIEDTGKLFPLAELKLGFIAASNSVAPAIRHILSDILLSVSPFVLTLVHEMATDSLGGGADSLESLIAGNRALVKEALDGISGVELLDGDARVSVSRLRFPSAMAAESCRHSLEQKGIYTLPCGPFFWADHKAGETQVRLALARDTSVLRQALAELRIELTRLI